MATASLGLPTDPRTTIFRKIVTVLQQDEVLSRVVGAVNSGRWFVWDGSRNAEQGFASNAGISVRLTPHMQRMDWLDETEQICPLIIFVEFLIPGSDIDDVINFQGCIERALYPPATPQSVVNALMALGAETGLISFERPADDPGRLERSNGCWLATSAISLNVRRVLNP